MTNSLDNILSGKGEATPEPEKETPQATPEVATEQVETTEQEPTSEGGSKTVPLEALHAERQKAKRYTEQIASFEQTLKDREQAWERRFGQILERLTPQQQPEQRPDFFADPDAAVDARLRTAFAPFVQHISQMSESVSRRFAISEHGQEAVQSAYGDMERRLASDPATRGEYQRIMGSGDPWGELVKWHKRESALAEIGNDPNAYREKLKAEVLAELQNGNGQAASGAPAAPVMPSNLANARNVGNRSGPAWTGPRSLNDIFKR